MFETYGIYAVAAGALLVVVGYLWLSVRAWHLSVWWGLAVLVLPPAAIIVMIGKFRKVAGPAAMSLIANQYRHCEREMTLAEAPDPTDETSVFRQAAAKAGNAVMDATLIDEIWTAVNRRIAAHFMENYRRLIDRLPS